MVAPVGSYVAVNRCQIGNKVGFSSFNGVFADDSVIPVINSFLYGNKLYDPTTSITVTDRKRTVDIFGGVINV